MQHKLLFVWVAGERSEQPYKETKRRIDSFASTGRSARGHEVCARDGKKVLANCRGGGIGRRAGFKIRCWQQRASSSLALGTIQDSGDRNQPIGSFFLCILFTNTLSLATGTSRVGILKGEKRDSLP